MRAYLLLNSAGAPLTGFERNGPLRPVAVVVEGPMVGTTTTYSLEQIVKQGRGVLDQTADGVAERTAFENAKLRIPAVAKIQQILTV